MTCNHRWRIHRKWDRIFVLLDMLFQDIESHCCKAYNIEKSIQQRTQNLCLKNVNWRIKAIVIGLGHDLPLQYSFTTPSEELIIFSIEVGLVKLSFEKSKTALTALKWKKNLNLILSLFWMKLDLTFYEISFLDLTADCIYSVCCINNKDHNTFEFNR